MRKLCLLALILAAILISATLAAQSNSPPFLRAANTAQQPPMVQPPETTPTVTLAKGFLSGQGELMLMFLQEAGTTGKPAVVTRVIQIKFEVIKSEVHSMDIPE